MSKNADAPVHMAEAYALSPQALEYVPTIQQLAKVEDYLARPAIFTSDFVRLSEVEIDAKIADAIHSAERHLIELQYLQRVRAEQVKPEVKPWLRKVLGL